MAQITIEDAIKLGASYAKLRSDIINVKSIIKNKLYSTIQLNTIIERPIGIIPLSDFIDTESILLEWLKLAETKLSSLELLICEHSNHQNHS